jgi:hypothetical protein
MALKNFKRVIAETPADVDSFVEEAMNILERIHELLEEKFAGRQKLLADKLGKSEAEISRMLNGVQNFTLKTITRLEWAFGAKIIAVCTNDPAADYIAVKMPVANEFRRITLIDQLMEKEQFDGIPVKTRKAATSKTIYSAS